MVTPITRRNMLALGLCAGFAPLTIGARTIGLNDQAGATEALWRKLRDGGYTILLRHARAPGTGDPRNFELGNCATQRNLDSRGRLDARKIGARMSASGAVVTEVLTSQWCRTTDTAELAFENNEIEAFAPLNSFFRTPEREDEQTAAVLERIYSFNGIGNQVMVTHQVNITALTGERPREGTAVVVRPNATFDAIETIGRLRF
ncbi:MAG: histidine phosphatase family protein [Pseudomonadota bacterium]